MEQLTPRYGIKLDHWTYEGVGPTGCDQFCAYRRYHILVTRDLGGIPGLHLSVRPWCYDPKKTTPRKLWIKDIDAVAALLGVRFTEYISSTGSGIYHFYEEDQ